MRLGVAGKLSSSTKDLCVAGRRELGNEWVGLGRSSDEMIGLAKGSELATANRHKYLDLGELQSSSFFSYCLWAL